MTLTVASFRLAFPEFASTTTYPDASIGFWVGLSPILINVERWGSAYEYGAQLFIAHNLALGFGAGGGSQGPGQVKGPVTSACVDKVSYSRDPSSAMDPKNGHWNLTTYGLRYIRLVLMMGAGPMHVGAPDPMELQQQIASYYGPIGIDGGAP